MMSKESGFVMSQSQSWYTYCVHCCHLKDKAKYICINSFMLPPIKGLQL